MPDDPQILDYSDPKGFVPIKLFQSQKGIITNSDLGVGTILQFQSAVTTQRQNFELWGQ
jgi:hypothetical protein